MNWRVLVENIGIGIDIIGVLVIVFGVLFSTVQIVKQKIPDPYRHYRRDLGKWILLGLEFLVAGDIIRTVAIDPDLKSVSVLGLIVLIRTFLSMALEVELSGRWPWQKSEAH